MATTAELIRDWLEQGITDGATHMLVVCDTFDYEDYPVYVSPDEILEVVYERYAEKSMQRVMEIYDLSEDLEVQLKEKRAWHT